MKIRTEAGTIEVELGAFVFDEKSDTFTTWDNLGDATRDNLEIITGKLEASVENLRKAITA
jgi:hypothetical protein